MPLRITGAPVSGTDAGFAGAIAPTFPGFSHTTRSLTANTGFFSRLVVTRQMTVTKIAFVVTTVDAGNPNVDVGVYDAAGARLASSGAVAGKLTATGVSVVDLTAPVTLTAGTVYYVGLSSPSAVPVIGGGSLANTSVPLLMGSAGGPSAGGTAAAAHPLPASVTISHGSSGTLPVLAVKEA